MTENIDCHASSSFLIIDGQAQVVALGMRDAAMTVGDLANTYVNTLLKAGSEYHRIDIVFDRHRVETINGTTRTRRTIAARRIRWLVEGRDVPLPKNGRIVCRWLIKKSRSSTFLV